MLYKKEANILVFLFIMWIILVVTLIIITAKIEVKIVNLAINSQNKEHISDKYKIITKLKIFGNIPIIKFTLNKKKIKKIQQLLKMNEKVKQLEKDILQNKNKFDKKMVKGLKEFSKGIYVENLELEVELGTENAFLTSMLVAIFSSILAISFSRIHIKEKNIVYKFKPVYRNENSIKIEISGIFQIKLIHIINTIYVLNKKGGRKNHERTSNRRSYDYSYE